MKKNVKSKLEKTLEQDLANYANYGFNDQEKFKAITVISKEVATIKEIEKQNMDIARDEKRLELEREKFEFEKSCRLMEIRNLQEKNEKDRQIQVSKLIEDKSQNKKQIWISIAGVAAPLVLGIVSKCIYAGLAFNAQKHDYEDYKLESSSSKEQRNNLLK